MNSIRMNPLRATAPKLMGTTMPQVGITGKIGDTTSGPQFSHLGHFGKPAIMAAGHNTNGRMKVGGNTRKSGTYKGKSNKLGHGGRAQQLRDKGVPGGVIGKIARSKGAAPGQRNYHG